MLAVRTPSVNRAKAKKAGADPAFLTPPKGDGGGLPIRSIGMGMAIVAVAALATVAQFAPAPAGLMAVPAVAIYPCHRG